MNMNLYNIKTCIIFYFNDYYFSNDNISYRKKRNNISYLNINIMILT